MHLVSTLKKQIGIAFLLQLIAMLCGIAPAAHATESWIGSGAPGQGGLVRGLYIQPNTLPTKLITGIYGSGIFISTDGGTSWAPSNTGLVNKRVRQVRGQPVAVPGGSPAWILAATEGGGMYRSTDGGVTWSASNTGLQCFVVNHFDVFNGDGTISSSFGTVDTVYAATGCATNSGVYKSIDGGVNWTKMDWSSSGVSSADVNAVTVAGGSPNFGQVVWASTLGQGLFRSNDGGGTWVRRNGTDPNILSGPNGSGSSAYVNTVRQGTGFQLASVEGGGIFRSIDNGLNWAAVNSGLPTNPTILNGPISNISGNQYVAVAGLGFYKNTISSTAAPSWEFFAGPAQGLPAMVRSIDDDPNAPTTWYATTLAGVYRSLDSGASWSPIVNGLGGGYAHSSTTDPNNPNVVLGAADAMYRSTDGGVTWVKSSTGLTDQPITPRFARGLANVALVGTTDSGVFKTVDGGLTWAPSNTGLPATPDLVGMDARVRTDPIVNGLFYVTLEGRGVYKSLDYGATWSAVNSGLNGLALEAQTLGIDPVDSSYLYLTTAGGFYRSPDAGASWSLLTGLPTSGIEAGQVHVDPNNQAVAYAAAFIPNTSAGPAAGSGVWKTTDFGNTWTQVLNKLARRVAVVGASGYTSIFAGAWDDVGGGVLKSIDGGATWAPVNTGLTSNNVRQFETTADRSKLLRASLMGGGIMNFTNGADTAVAGVAAALEAFRAIVNTQGNNLDYLDLLPGYDGGFQSEGMNATAESKNAASDLRGVTLTSFTITKINSYDDVTGVINVAGTVTGTSPEGPFTDFFDGNNDGIFIFKRQGDGSYRIYGNQQIAKTGVQVSMQTDYGPGFSQGPRQNVNFDVEAPVGILSTAVNAHSVPSSSPNNWTGAGQLPLNLTTGSNRTETVQGSPPPAPSETITNNAFFGGFDPATPITSGTVFQVSLTMADTTPVTYNVPVVGTPVTNTGTDAITNVTVNASTATSFPASVMSSPINVGWTLPTGYAIREVRLNSHVHISVNETCPGSEVTLGAAVILGEVTVPTTCGAGTVNNVGISVQTEGFNGERSQFIYHFDITTAGPPPAPTGVTATPFADGSIQMNWNAVSGATSYNVYMATTTGVTKTNYVLLGGHLHPGILTTTYTHPVGAPAGTTYYLVVTALNAQGESVESAQLSATIPAVDAPAVTLSTSSLNFGSQTVSTASPNQSVTITNSGSAVLNIASIASSSSIEWVIVGNPCGATLAVSANCVVTLSFVPQAAGARTGSLTITSDAPGSPHAVSLGGTGVTASIPVLSTSGGPISVQEGGTATFGTYLLKSDNTTQAVNATWSGGSPGSLSPSGVLTVGANAVTTNTGTTLTATFSDPVLTGGQTLTATRAVLIQDGTDHWVGNNQPGQGGDIRQLLAISDDGATTLVALVYGRGVFRSTDGGANWTPGNNGLGDRRVRSVTVLPDGTNNTLLLATEFGVYRSITRGGSWTAVNTGLTCRTGRYIASKDASTVYFATNSCGVFKSSNGGVSWTPVNNGLPNPLPGIVNMSVISTTDFVAIGTAGAGVYRSTDGGANWTAINNGLIPGPGGLLVTRILTNPSFYLVTVEGSGIFRSTNGGANWSLVTNGVPTGAQYGPFQRNGSETYIGADGFGTFKSVDNGVSWTSVPVSGVARRRTGPIPDPSVGSTLYFRTAAGIYKSLDSGSTWSKASSGLPGGFTHGTNTDPGNANTVIAVADTVYKSTDGGTTWGTSDSGITGHTAINPGSIGYQGRVGSNLVRKTSGLYVATVNYGVFRSTDNGASWSAVNNGLPVLVGQSVRVRPDSTNPSGLFALFNNYVNGVYRTSDGGASWQSISGDLSGDALLVRDVSVDLATGHLYAATRIGLHKSVNGGSNWTLVANSTACTPLVVRVDAGTTPSTIYWAGSCTDSSDNPTSASGLYRSTDGGVTSTQLRSSDEVFDVQVVRNSGAMSLWVSSWSPLSAVASSLGWTGKILRSTDNGATFQSVTAGILPVRPRGLEVDSTGTQMLHLNTGGAGIYTFVADTQVPSVPAGMTATAASSSQINLAWNASSDSVGVTQYKIYRDSTLLTTLTGAPPATSYSDTGLTASTMYSYTVQACDAAGNCSAQSSSASASRGELVFIANLEPGFNLIGNSLNITLNVASIFGNQDAQVAGITPNILTIWKWNAVDRRWAFYSPALTATGIASYAASHNYDLLATINPGEGYWVNAIGAMSLPAQTGTGFNWFGADPSLQLPANFSRLPTGFNLIAHADNVTPSEFNYNVNATPPAQEGVIPTNNFFTLWAWDAVARSWYFYSPLFESTGGLSGVCTYAQSRFYLCFDTKTLGLGVGFWVNRP